jgi:BRCT domain type II-containing protein
MPQEWVESQGSEELPLQLTALAMHVGISIKPMEPHLTAPGCTGHRGQRKKTSSPTKGVPPRKVFLGQRIVLSGTWPGLEGGQGLTLGKDTVKAIIEEHGGSVTLAISQLTKILVIGDKPGQKKILHAHENGIPIVELDQIKDVIINNKKSIQDLFLALCLEVVAVILE